jgi:hypothetical protein
MKVCELKKQIKIIVGFCNAYGVPPYADFENDINTAIKEGYEIDCQPIFDGMGNICVVMRHNGDDYKELF